ncbi:MAG: trigger factor [Desulfovibrionaceae bacterium]|nr:trigger factor [Desulfovibrionaceae bacterium]
MKYTVTDLSKVKKSVQINVPAEDVDAKIKFMVKDLVRDLKLPGFRPGKVPHSVAEKRFKAQIYKEATTALVNECAAEAVKQMNVTPITEIDYDGPELVERGKEFDFSFSFEILPDFELPAWEGLEIEEEIEPYDEARTDETIERIRLQMSELKPLEVSRPPLDGEVAFVDFSATDDEGNPVEGFRGTGYQLTIGRGQLQEDFEAIIKKLAPGESGEGQVKLDENINNEFAGKTINVKATVVSLAERVLPEITEEFAEKIGAGSVENMRSSIEKAHRENLKRFAKENSQGKLLDSLIEQVEYDLPETMVASRQNALMAEFRAEMRRAGKPDPKDWDMTEAEVEADLLKQAQKFVKGEMFLLKIAEKEKITVTPQEMEAYLVDIAQRSGLDPRQLQEYYHNNNLMHTLVDRIRTEKALDLIYDRAKVTEVEAKPKTDAE